MALGQALVRRPDVLLLDEPTNHLDLDSIEWLEKLLIDFKGSVVTITHDRTFLDRVATRIVELDRGRLRSYPGNFSQYQVQKEEQLAQEAIITAKADKLLAQEEIWIRKGVEARRTRSQGRITRLEGLRASRAARREALGSVKLDVASGLPSGKIVAELTRRHQGFRRQDDRAQFHLHHPARRQGRPDRPQRRRQDHAAQADPRRAGSPTAAGCARARICRWPISTRCAMRSISMPRSRTSSAPAASGSRSATSASTSRATSATSCSRRRAPTRPCDRCRGGERNRLLLARLFARPANVLVLDEPTNDLDIDTLELLEDLLQNYDGTVFLVSHDRAFLDNVVTSTIAFEGDGQWREYEGGVQDWLTQSRAIAGAGAARGRGGSPVSRPGREPPQAAAAAAIAQPKKLSYKEQRELEDPSRPDRDAGAGTEANPRGTRLDGETLRQRRGPRRPAGRAQRADRRRTDGGAGAMGNARRRTLGDLSGKTGGSG